MPSIDDFDLPQTACSVCFSASCPSFKMGQTENQNVHGMSLIGRSNGWFMGDERVFALFL